jgi:hypothetical protein
MNKLKTVVCIITMLILCANAYAENPSADEILKKVAATYKTIKTYKCKGTRSSFSKSPMGTGSGGESTFTILLKKPNMYLITWTSAIPEIHAALWSNGTQPYLYRLRTYNKMKNDEMAVKNASRFSAPSRIPSLFLPEFKGEDAPFSWLKDQKVERIEKVGEEDCYVIIGSSDLSKKVTIWISKTRYLIEKIEFSGEPPEGGRKKPGMTEEQKEIEKKRAENYKRRNIVSTYTEVYMEISSPELNKEDFNFIVPEGTAFRDDWPGD